MAELLENSTENTAENAAENTEISTFPADTSTAISPVAVQALADALAKIEAYTPTTWVDNEAPDIDAAHLNKAEQAIMRVTTAMNSAVDTIKDLQSQITTTNNNLSNGSVTAHFSPMNGNEANFCTGYNYDNKMFCFNYRGAESQINDYIFGDGKGGVVAKLSEFVSASRLDTRISISWSNDPTGLIVTVDGSSKKLIPLSVMTDVG